MMLPTDEETQRFRGWMGKLGYELCGAETLKQAEQLQKDIQGQMVREQEMELAKDEAMTFQARQATRDRLYNRMTAVGTSPYEKEFIRLYLESREKKHDIFKRRFTSQVGHLDALEFDNPNEHTASLLDRV